MTQEQYTMWRNAMMNEMIAIIMTIRKQDFLSREESLSFIRISVMREKRNKKCTYSMMWNNRRYVLMKTKEDLGQFESVHQDSFTSTKSEIKTEASPKFLKRFGIVKKLEVSDSVDKLVEETNNEVVDITNIKLGNS